MSKSVLGQRIGTTVSSFGAAISLLTLVLVYGDGVLQI